MADLFGTPLGDIAYNKNVLVQMQALGTVAETRNRMALASGREEKLRSAERLQTLNEEYRALSEVTPTERDEFGKSILRSTGRTPTQDDLLQVLAGPTDVAAIEQKAIWFWEHGEDATAMEMLESAALTRQRRSQANQNKAQGAQSNAKTRQAKNQAIADQAAAVGRSPEAYARYQLARQADPQNPQWILPPELATVPYDQGKFILEDLRRRGLGAIAVSKEEESKLNSKARREANKATTEAAVARAAVARIELQQRKWDYDLAVKTDGPDAERAAELEEAQIQKSKDSNMLDRLVYEPFFPLEPHNDADEGGAVKGRVYTEPMPDGSYIRVVFQGYNEDDKAVFIKAPDEEAPKEEKTDD